MKGTRGVPAGGMLHQALELLVLLGKRRQELLVLLGKLLAQVLAVLLVLLGKLLEKLGDHFVLLVRILAKLRKKLVCIFAMLSPQPLDHPQGHLWVLLRLPWWVTLPRRLLSPFDAVTNDARHRNGSRPDRVEPLLGGACGSYDGEPAVQASAPPRAVCRHLCRRFGLAPRWNFGCWLFADSGAQHARNRQH
jgi:hypothetical protein